jgi:hypothetical protein
MKKWSIWTNNYYFTAEISLFEAPWYVFFIEEMIQFICHWFPNIPFPKIKIIRDGYETNLKDYYGGTRALFHIYVCTPIYNWCWDNTKKEWIEFPYKKLERMFPEIIKDSDYYFKETEDIQELERLHENKRYSDLLSSEFDEVYNKLKKIYEARNEKNSETGERT